MWLMGNSILMSGALLMALTIAQMHLKMKCVPHRTMERYHMNYHLQRSELIQGVLSPEE